MATYLKNILISFLGPMNTLIYFNPSDGTTIYDVDIEWIFSAILFLIIVYSVFRIIGALICSKQ